jgi:hypothetical protein
MLRKEFDMSFLRILTLLSVVVILGCGSDIKSVPVTPAAPPPAAQSAKAILTDLANTGEMGSAMETLRQNLEQIKQTDAAKGDALLTELKALEAEKNADQVKAKAKAMADKL